MALDLGGIQNVEFYSGHYLDAVLEGDLKALFKRWADGKKEHGTRPPPERLNALAERYFNSRAQAEGELDTVERWRPCRDFHVHFIQALGYAYKPSAELLDDDTVCPTLLALRRDGNPFLWIIDAPSVLEDDEDPLVARPLSAQLPTDAEGRKLPNLSWREFLGEVLFRMDSGPRWVLFLAGTEALLMERNKWPQGRYLRFDFGDLFSRREVKALRATAGLLHRDVLAPDAGVCLHDTLDENSHKHAFAVSGDLKHGVRRSVELLANEAVHYRRQVQKLGVFNEEELARKLTSECLTWLYRMLFLFYVEARSAELDVVPMGSNAYREGYSLEKLRDLEQVPLTTPKAQNGYYIHESLRTLFSIVNQGFPEMGEVNERLLYEGISHNSMEIDALNSPLFDDDRLEILKGVKFRNHVLQEALQLLSLSAQKKRRWLPRKTVSSSQGSPPPSARRSRPTSCRRAASVTTRKARSSRTRTTRRSSTREATLSSASPAATARSRPATTRRKS